KLETSYEEVEGVCRGPAAKGVFGVQVAYKKVMEVLVRYTLMFLTYSDETLEIEKFKRARENKIKFAYDYGNLNESYVNEKINLSDDYFQEIINSNSKKIYSPVQIMVVEKIIINLEDEVVVEFTMFQNLQVEVKELESENEGLKLLVEELTNARECVEVTLRQRDEMISAHCQKLQLFEELFETFSEIQSEFDSDIFYDTQDNSENDLILSLQTQLKETAKLVVLAQRVKDFDDVKIELSRIIDKFETYCANLQ
ncbi:hypothetical protein Tco_0121705, partial [Tanacetum coccineum]